jgi:hypothetical protein
MLIGVSWTVDTRFSAVTTISARTSFRSAARPAAPVSAGSAEAVLAAIRTSDIRSDETRDDECI